MTRDLNQVVESYAYAHKELLEKWLVAKTRISELLARFAKLTADEIVAENAEVAEEITFKLFGARCYARFLHNLDQGFIEYGVLVVDDGRALHRSLTRVEFDLGGTVLGDAEGGGVHNNRIHIEVILNRAPELVALFYGVPVTKRSGV